MAREMMSFKVDTELLAWLTERSAAMGMTRSELCRAVLNKYMDEKKDKRPRAGRVEGLARGVVPVSAMHQDDPEYDRIIAAERARRGVVKKLSDRTVDGQEISPLAARLIAEQEK